MAGEVVPYRCPTPCDDDCEINGWGCHEAHDVRSHREHDPEACKALALSAMLRFLAERGYRVELGCHADASRPELAWFASAMQPGAMVQVSARGSCLGEAAAKVMPS